jgi:hypothetical protein
MRVCLVADNNHSLVDVAPAVVDELATRGIVNPGSIVDLDIRKDKTVAPGRVAIYICYTSPPKSRIGAAVR